MNYILIEKVLDLGYCQTHYISSKIFYFMTTFIIYIIIIIYFIIYIIDHFYKDNTKGYKNS